MEPFDTSHLRDWLDGSPKASYHLPTVPVSVEKVSVALGRDELEWARERAEREGTSLSAVLTQATRQVRELEAAQTRQDAAWAEFLEWATNGKGLTQEAVASATAELDRVRASQR
jgi:hypothetical protein